MNDRNTRPKKSSERRLASGAASQVVAGGNLVDTGRTALVSCLPGVLGVVKHELKEGAVEGEGLKKKEGGEGLLIT